MTSRATVDRAAILGAGPQGPTASPRAGGVDVVGRAGRERHGPPSGKGEGGKDTTPPAAVTDLALDPTQAVGFHTVPVTWTETADDDDDPGSGPVYVDQFWYRPKSSGS